MSEVKITGIGWGDNKNVLLGIVGLDPDKFSRDVVERLEEERETFPKPVVDRTELDRVKMQRKQAQEELASLSEETRAGQADYERALLSGEADLEALERRLAERASKRAALETRLKWLDNLEKEREADYLARINQADQLTREEFKAAMQNRLSLLSEKVVSVLPCELLIDIAVAFAGGK